MCYSITTHAPLPRAHTLPPACSSLTSLQPPSPPQGRLPRAWWPEGDNALRTTCTQHACLLPRPRCTGPRTQTLSGLGRRPGYPFLPWRGLTWESGPGLCPPQPAGWTPRPRYMWVQGGAQRLKGWQGTLGGLVLRAPPNPGQPGMKHPGSWHFIPSSHRFLAAPCRYCPHYGQQACRVERRVQGHSSGQSRNLNTGRLAPGPTFPPRHAAQAASHPQGWGALHPAAPTLSLTALYLMASSSRSARLWASRSSTRDSSCCSSWFSSCSDSTEAISGAGPAGQRAHDWPPPTSRGTASPNRCPTHPWRQEDRQGPCRELQLRGPFPDSQST